MSRWAMSIDLDRCTACGACDVACAQENNVHLGDPQRPDQIVRWMEILPVATGKFPDAKARLLPMPCQHCDDPACTKVCPTFATYLSPEGLVPQIYTQCIGCRYCVNACPYTCKHYTFSTPEFPEPLARGLNPDVSLRMSGVVEKCNFCYHRLLKARDAAAVDGKPFKSTDYQTACQQACPTKAIEFGDKEDETSAVATAGRDARSFRLLEELGLEPKVTYLKETST